MIYIIQLGCGAGKTTGIYIKGRRNKFLIKKTVLAQPSIELCIESAKKLADINPTLIVSSNDQDESVLSQLEKALNRGDDFIIITHAALRLLKIDKSILEQYELILDEVFQPFNLEQFYVTDDQTKLRLNTSSLFQLTGGNKLCDLDNKEWYDLGVHNFKYKKPLLFKDSNQWNRISNPNTIVMAKGAQIKNIFNNNVEKVSLVTMTNPDVITAFGNTIIYAAAFDVTSMRHLFDYKDIEYKTLKEFEPHNCNINVYQPRFGKHMLWSKNLDKMQPDIKERFDEFVNDRVGDELLYYTRNTNQEVDNLHISKKTKINHNAHGSNKFLDYKHYAEMGAIQLNDIMINFFEEVIGLSRSEIIVATHTYNTYQLLMRSSARVNGCDDAVNLYTLDSEMASYLPLFFKEENIKYESVIDVYDKRYIEQMRKKLCANDLAYFDQLLEQDKDIIEQFKIDYPSAIKTQKQNVAQNGRERYYLRTLKAKNPSITIEEVREHIQAVDERREYKGSRKYYLEKLLKIKPNATKDEIDEYLAGKPTWSSDRPKKQTARVVTKSPNKQQSKINKINQLRAALELLDLNVNDPVISKRDSDQLLT